MVEILFRFWFSFSASLKLYYSSSLAIVQHWKMALYNGAYIWK